VAKKVPALPALGIGVVAGAIAAVIFQGDLIAQMSSGDTSIKALYKVVIVTAYDGFKITTDNEIINSLFNRGGMSGMLNTVWLIVVAMCFGGVMEATGMIQKISMTIMKMVKGTTSLVASTISTSIFLNMTVSDQYLAIVVTGKIFKGTYQKYGLKAKNFSRTIEDGATVTSVLIPWNSGGAYFAGILGVATLDYLPYCFFNLACPLVAIVAAAIGFGQAKLDEKTVV
jgi:NhaC family Na+:H+ antiporter